MVTWLLLMLLCAMDSVTRLRCPRPGQSAGAEGRPWAAAAAMPAWLPGTTCGPDPARKSAWAPPSMAPDPKPEQNKRPKSSPSFSLGRPMSLPLTFSLLKQESFYKLNHKDMRGKKGRSTCWRGNTDVSKVEIFKQRNRQAWDEALRVSALGFCLFLSVPFAPIFPTEGRNY